VPKKRRRLLQDILNRPKRIVITVRSGENEHAELHGFFLEKGL
jgi:hypothetical protein